MIKNKLGRDDLDEKLSDYPKTQQWLSVVGLPKETIKVSVILHDICKQYSKFHVPTLQSIAFKGENYHLKTQIMHTQHFRSVFLHMKGYSSNLGRNCIFLSDIRVLGRILKSKILSSRKSWSFSILFY